MIPSLLKPVPFLPPYVLSRTTAHEPCFPLSAKHGTLPERQVKKFLSFNTLTIEISHNERIKLHWNVTKRFENEKCR